MAGLVIVSNRLPVSVKKVNGKLEFFPSVGGLATGLASYTTRRGTKWIGWPGLPSDDLTAKDRAQIMRELKHHRCFPVFLTSQQIEEFYNGYSNSVLWPLFHELPLRPHAKKVWQTYRAVNELFAQAVVSLSIPGSTIWVHDYQLMLLPTLLRAARSRDKIGFFLHIPFPSVAILRSLTETKKLLAGVLGADLVGFHTVGYTENFLAACRSLTGSIVRDNQVLLGERVVRVTEFPMGIDYAKFVRATKQRAVKASLRKLRRVYRSKKVILTVDRLDPSKGLAERLAAYQEFLKQNPQLHGKVMMVMIVVPSRAEIDEYKNLKRRLDSLLAEITTEFGSAHWRPVAFIYQALPFEMVAAYYQLADVAFIAPIRDGMNLVAKEYMASKPKHNGVLILSETAGAAEELRDAVLVNPNQPHSLVKGLEQALSMPKRELRRRAAAMHQHIASFTVETWAANFMKSLKQPLTLPKTSTKGFNPSRQAEVIAAYGRARRRLLLFDYDGVLSPFVNNPAKAIPGSKVRLVLAQLAARPASELVIISGRSKTDLQTWFGDLPIALAAEHGALFKKAGAKNWHKTTGPEPGWKQPITDLFKYYARVTPGAHVEQKDWSVVWHYRAASPYYAQKHLVALRRLLRPLLAQYKLSLKEGHKVLEVHPADISKGRVAQQWLSRDYDFILAIGDDATDEDMFAALPPSAYSIKVGRGQTLARYRLKDVDAVLELLKTF